MGVELSVLVPVRNGEATLERCLASIRASAYRDYELIVVDDASTDRTGQIASRMADKVLRSDVKLGISRARCLAASAATGRIHVHTDSDVLLLPHTLGKISEFFRTHPTAAAMTGRLSTRTPEPGYFSRYKNIYMHYIFGLQPERVTFLYGSLHALRADRADRSEAARNEAEDTNRGMELFLGGAEVYFVRDIEVVHLKRYTWAGFFRNDFRIPRAWAKLFLRTRGWRRLGRNGTGFAHAPKVQLASVILAPACLAVAVYEASRGTLAWDSHASILALLWLWLNLDFLFYLARVAGFAFAGAGVLVTFADHLVMASGIAAGSWAYLRGERESRSS